MVDRDAQQRGAARAQNQQRAAQQAAAKRAEQMNRTSARRVT